MSADSDDLAPALEGVSAERAAFVRALDRRIARFCEAGPLEARNVVFHSTGVNYAHQFYVLSLLGPSRLARFREVHFVSGSVIAAVVYHAYKSGAYASGAVPWGRADALKWERHFFRAHGLSPLRSLVAIPAKLLSGRPVLSTATQMAVIRSGVGEEFGSRTVSSFPPNFRFWLLDRTRDRLAHAEAGNALGAMRLDELAVAAAAVPRIFAPFEWGGAAFVDPMYTSAATRLSRRLASLDGPTLVSNMLLDRHGPNRELIRPHMHGDGRLLMLTEMLRLCFGIGNRDHIAGLETGMWDIGLCRD